MRGYGAARGGAAVSTMAVTTAGRMGPFVVTAPGRGSVATPRVGRLRGSYVVELGVMRLVRGVADTSVEDWCMLGGHAGGSHARGARVVGHGWLG